jgi:hypothetical protein
LSKVSIDAKITRAELAAIICKAIHEQLGDQPVLVGGAVVSIYTEGRYLSDDLDIVTWRDNRKLRPVMAGLGFAEKGSYWEHPETNLLVQFLDSPVMIGRKHVKVPSRLRTKAGELPIISPLDSACDRLAWFLSDSDPQTLEQCVDLIVTQKIPLAAVAKWLRGETWPEQTRKSTMALLEKKVERSRKRSKR